MPVINGGIFADSISDMSLDRSIFLFDYFYQDSAKDIVQELMRLDQENESPIYLFINSYGGAVYSLFSILDTMANMKAPVATVCLGEADSCGAVLLSAGVQGARYIGQRSRSMIHEVSTFTWGKVSEMEEDLKLAKEVNEKIVNILAENMGKDAEALAEIMKKDTFYDAEESLEMGLVDVILDDSTLEQEEEDVKNFVNSFSGHTKDTALLKVMCNKRGGGQPQKLTGVGDTQKLISNNVKKILKGEKLMDLKELLAKLKSEHNIDVTTLQDSVSTLTEQVAVANNKAAKAESDLANYKKEREKTEIEDLLDSLIDDKKSTQDLNEGVYRELFTNAGITKAKELADKLQVLDIKDERTSDEVEDAADIAGDVQAKSDDAAIKNHMKEHNINNYSVAADAYYAELEKKGDNA